LAGERVSCRLVKQHRRFDEGIVESVIAGSDDRVEPRCPWFGLCGGCAMQHISHAAQLRIKQTYLKESLQHIGGVSPKRWLEPLIGPEWRYRTKARLGVRFVPQKERVLVGFREVFSNYLAIMESCEVLHDSIASRLGELAQLIAKMSAPDKIAQIELAAGEEDVVLVVRNMVALTREDIALWQEFSQAANVKIYLQPGGPETIAPMTPDMQTTPFYRLPAYDVSLEFEPSDFTQVNPQINRKMIDQAITLLALEPDAFVLDLFCGLGNFTLPLARQTRRVVGVEGDAGLVERARLNAQRNAIDNAEFYTANLAEQWDTAPWLEHAPDAILLDPPRSGAAEIIPVIARLGAKRILYVSCHPATLGRDAGLLVNDHGYRLECAGIMDMFPHTAHVESMALFIQD
jgi:23S rRNA (uracil1939-C5)-methyltransferase